MSIPLKYLAKFEAGEYYHVYNRTNNKEVLFRNDRNYECFLKLCDKYLEPLCRSFAWCLIPNHFHMLLKVRPLDVLYQHIQSTAANRKLGERLAANNSPSAHEIISNAFVRLFTSYAMTFNHALARSGNLFHRPFKRVLIESEAQLMSTAIYIHTNPKHHGLTHVFESYEWSSFNRIIANHLEPEPAFLLDMFGGITNYVAAHRDRADQVAFAGIEDC